MKETRQGSSWFAKVRHPWRFMGTFLLALALAAPAYGQQAPQIEVSGTVTSTDGVKLHGVTVRIRGTSTTTTTDQQGRYTLTAPSNAVLVFAMIGFRGTAQNVAGRTTIDALMDNVITVLPEVVVTGYQT